MEPTALAVPSTTSIDDPTRIPSHTRYSVECVRGRISGMKSEVPCGSMEGTSEAEREAKGASYGINESTGVPE